MTFNVHGSSSLAQSIYGVLEADMPSVSVGYVGHDFISIDHLAASVLYDSSLFRRELCSFYLWHHVLYGMFFHLVLVDYTTTDTS